MYLTQLFYNTKTDYNWCSDDMMISVQVDRCVEVLGCIGRAFSESAVVTLGEPQNECFHAFSHIIKSKECAVLLSPYFSLFRELQLLAGKRKMCPNF